jgi:hypothetical protein
MPLCSISFWSTLFQKLLPSLPIAITHRIRFNEIKKREIEMKTKLLILVAMTLVSSTGHAFAAAQTILDGQSYPSEWCDDVRTPLENAIQVGDAARTYDEEVSILEYAIQRTQGVGNVKFQKFFQYTLQSAMQDVNVYSGDMGRQALLLRTYIEFALEDLSWLDRSWDDNNNGPYVTELLRRAERFGLQAPTDEEEILFLSRAAERAVELISDSDYRREERYACTAQTLSDALNEVQNPALSSRTQVELLRNSIEGAINQMGYCRY